MALFTRSSDNHDEPEETHYYKAESNTILKHDKNIKPDPPMLPWPFDTRHSFHGTSDHEEDMKKQVEYLDELGSSRRTILETR